MSIRRRALAVSLLPAVFRASRVYGRTLERLVGKPRHLMTFDSEEQVRSLHAAACTAAIEAVGKFGRPRAGVEPEYRITPAMFDNDLDALLMLQAYDGPPMEFWERYYRERPRGWAVTPRSST